MIAREGFATGPGDVTTAMEKRWGGRGRALSLICAIGVVAGAHTGFHILQALKHHGSWEQMGGLLYLYREYSTQGEAWSETTFRRLAQLRSDPNSRLRDSWGRPFVFEHDPDLGHVIRSFGSDGVRGDCCTARIENRFREDVVLSLEHGSLQTVRGTWGVSTGIFIASILSALTLLVAGAISGPLAGAQPRATAP